MKKIAIIGASLALALTACDKEPTAASVVNPTPTPTPIPTASLFTPKLAVAGGAPDYSSSDVILIGDNETETDKVLEEQLSTTEPSDIRLTLLNNQLFRLGRSGFDNITQINFAPQTELLNVGHEFSLLGEESAANPYAAILLNATTAYIARYGSNQLWVVNPQATSTANFYQSSIDLAQFSSQAGGMVNMADLALIDGKLFVLLENLDGWSPVSPSKVAVIDTSNNHIIDTDANTEGVQAIDLTVLNAVEFAEFGGQLYVAARGDAYGSDINTKYTGGIVSIDPQSYAVDLVLDDGDATAAPYGNITNLTFTGNGDLVFIGNQSWGDDGVFVKKANSDVVTSINVGSRAKYNLSDVKADAQFVYVAAHAQDGEAGGIKKFSVSDFSLLNTIETTYNPTQIILYNN